MSTCNLRLSWASPGAAPRLTGKLYSKTNYVSIDATRLRHPRGKTLQYAAIRCTTTCHYHTVPNLRRGVSVSVRLSFDINVKGSGYTRKYRATAQQARDIVAQDSV